MTEKYDVSGIEPPLEEVVSDPIIQLLMQSDGVSPASLLPLMETIGAKIQEQAVA